MATDPFESAFAFTASGHNHSLPYYGLTKREYFASIALQGLLAGDLRNDYNMNHCDGIARDAVQYADALIQALNAAAPEEVKA